MMSFQDSIRHLGSPLANCIPIYLPWVVCAGSISVVLEGDYVTSQQVDRQRIVDCQL